MNQPQTLQPESTGSELDWLAFQYVTEQLPENQRDAFEGVLAGDLAACEAVAAMTVLALQLKQAATPEVSRPVRQTARSSSSRFGSWIAVGSTVVALGWLFMLMNGQDSNTQTSVGATQSEEAAGLIAGWAGSNQDEVLAEENLFDLETLDLNDESTPKIPGWMIAAVSLENAEEKMGYLMDEPVEMKEN